MWWRYINGFMKTSINKLSKAKQKKLKQICDKIHSMRQDIGMIILFGSYVRGSWKEDSGRIWHLMKMQYYQNCFPDQLKQKTPGSKNWIMLTLVSDTIPHIRYPEGISPY